MFLTAGRKLELAQIFAWGASSPPPTPPDRTPMYITKQHSISFSAFLVLCMRYYTVTEV